MIRLAQVIVFAIGVSCSFAAIPCQASLYAPGDPSSALPVSGDGAVKALDFNEFERRFLALNNALDDRKKNGEVNEDRKKFLALTQDAQKVRNPSADETTALAGYLLRIGQSDQAIALLLPRTHDRQPNYFVFETLSHIHAVRGEWAEAIRCLNDGASLDTEMPLSMKGLSPAQREFWKRIDATYLSHYYQIHLAESDSRKGLKPDQLDKRNESEDVLPLFPAPTGKDSFSPVKFVNESGVYQPGRLAATEKAKLPPDAIPIVQQLLLWFPSDTRLYWLLAELYGAENNLRAANTIFEQLAWSRQYGNRKVMMEHRAVVRAALPKEAAVEDVPLTQSAAADSSPPPSGNVEAPITMRTIWWYFGVVGVVVLFAIIRGKIRRSRGECGPLS